MVKDILIYYRTDDNQSIYHSEFKDFMIGHKDYVYQGYFKASPEEIKELEYKRKIELFTQRFKEFEEWLEDKEFEEPVLNEFYEKFGVLRK